MIQQAADLTRPTPTRRRLSPQASRARRAEVVLIKLRPSRSLRSKRAEKYFEIGTLRLYSEARTKSTACFNIPLRFAERAAP